MRVFAFLAVLLATAPSLAQPGFNLISSVRFDSSPSSPANLNWRLATQEGSFVEVTFSGIVHKPPPLQTAFVMTRENTMGVDFPAWEAAINNPAYNRSIFNFGGLTMERPFTHDLYGQFQLDRMTVIIEEFSPVTNAFVASFLTDFFPVPESNTLFMVLVAAGTNACRSRKRSLT
jgi:hypothetical protein